MRNKVIDILTGLGAILTNNHFVGTSGRHFGTYLNKDALFPHTAETSKICALVAQKAKQLQIDVVVAPALGGLILSQWVAHHLSRIKNKKILATFTEKTPENNQIITRGYDKLIKNRNILVVEDFITTGGSVKKTINSVRKAGGRIVAVCALVNKNPRNVSSKNLGVPLITLADLPIESYDANDCPMCKINQPVNTVLGHGKKFKLKNVILRQQRKTMSN